MIISSHFWFFGVISCIIFHGFILFMMMSEAKDTLGVNETLDIYSTLESPNGLFRLDFLRRQGSNPYTRFLGIQFMEMNDPVWVALPSVILSDFPVLKMETDGRLLIFRSSGDHHISSGEVHVYTVNTDQTSMIRNNSTAILLDNGNLVLRAAADDGTVLWQSFDYPGNTWFPGMKLGWFNINLNKNMNTSTNQLRQQQLTSWIVSGQPSIGSFTLGLDPNNTNQLVVMQRGIEQGVVLLPFPYWRSGIWNGKNFSFLRFSNNFSNTVNFSHSCDEKDCYFSWNNNINNFIQLTDVGEIIVFSGRDVSRESIGAYCEEINNDREQEQGQGQGCIPATPSNCGGSSVIISDKFNKTSGTVVEWNYYNLSSNSNLGSSDCKEICRRNCSCYAYTSAYSNGTGCKFSQSTNGRFSYSQNDTEVFYIRANIIINNNSSPAPPSTITGSRQRNIKLIVSITVITTFFLALSLVLFIFFFQKPRNFRSGFSRNQDTREGDDDDDNQLHCYSLLTIKIATDNFSDEKKLGEGGFGPVYKGKLVNGQEIAVKRLSMISNHGVEQFKNEVKLISNLQHRNLVKLLGHCSQGEERLLVYEYLPNKSLDLFLFDDDASKRALLDWKMRVRIIQGIAQGILYLHKYSRLKIIHRDLKTSNILLDSDMNPKISDFGTARIFRDDNDSREKTRRIMGTYGYMSPEYAINGHFSEKSDVFSFGVMVLEIISGKKNTSFHHSHRHLNLLGYAWDLWKEERISELAAPMLRESICTRTSVRYVQVGLLCVQEIAADRSAMLDVVSMLTNESITLPEPKKPAFYNNLSSSSTNDDDDNVIPVTPHQPSSVNKLTISILQGR